MTEKTSDGKQIVKARLVACGHEEENKDSLRTDSPTIFKDNLQLLFANNCYTSLYNLQS